MAVAEQAKQVYEAELRARLEAECRNQFVAIEPVSKNYFVAETFLAAALAAKEAHPGSAVVCAPRGRCGRVSYRGNGMIVGEPRISLMTRMGVASIRAIRVSRGFSLWLRPKAAL